MCAARFMGVRSDSISTLGCSIKYGFVVLHKSVLHFHLCFSFQPDLAKSDLSKTHITTHVTTIARMVTTDKRHVRVAVTQAEPVWLDLDATVDKTCVLIAEAAGQGAELVSFPECWIPGYPAWIW